MSDLSDDGEQASTKSADGNMNVLDEDNKARLFVNFSLRKPIKYVPPVIRLLMPSPKFSVKKIYENKISPFSQTE